MPSLSFYFDIKLFNLDFFMNYMFWFMLLLICGIMQGT